MNYTMENTEGYSAAELAELNSIYEHRVSLLDEDEHENSDLPAHISERVLADYDAGREYIPDAIGSRDEGPLRVVRVVDLIPPDYSEITIALLDVQTSDGVTLEGRLVCILPDGSTETARGGHDQIRTREDIETDNQGDWLPVEEGILGRDDYEDGWVAFGGRTYGLRQQAYSIGRVEFRGRILEDTYAASATEIETGRTAKIYWVEREEYDPYEQDESDACDWGNPVRVDVWDE